VDQAGAPLTGRQLANTSDPIDSMAQQLAASQARNCEVRLLCLDASRPLNDWERRELAANHDSPRLVIATKCDSVEQDNPAQAELPYEAIATSALRGPGLDELRHALRQSVESLAHNETAAGMTAHRCAESLRTASESLARASELNHQAAGDELIGCELRLALEELGKVAGAVYTDDILERIFSRFCIGK
jgi:tRNA modification GTPase